MFGLENIRKDSRIGEVKETVAKMDIPRWHFG